MYLRQRLGRKQGCCKGQHDSPCLVLAAFCRHRCVGWGQKKRHHSTHHLRFTTQQIRSPSIPVDLYAFQPVTRDSNVVGSMDATFDRRPKQSKHHQSRAARASSLSDCSPGHPIRIPAALKASHLQTVGVFSSTYLLRYHTALPFECFSKNRHLGHHDRRHEVGVYSEAIRSKEVSDCRYDHGQDRFSFAVARPTLCHLFPSTGTAMKRSGSDTRRSVHISSLPTSVLACMRWCGLLESQDRATRMRTGL
ncbi:hypothetical protein BU16DRAFT_63407 [Lophium mytilinum]|uniref:Uncharacterized protein n=1 Tax=Lophium mytilinum TaxID=390894 RepID=A0A6A6QT08_9PEZI|nr:hypothetical protein BU16DRAFT_63407 [Lophium mytilinum]